MSWWRGVAGVVLAGVAAVGAVAWMGTRLPPEHTAVATGRVEASQDVVWNLVTDTATHPAWRKGLAKVVSRDGEGHCWSETQTATVLSFCTVQDVPESLHVVRVQDNQNFGGTWTYAFEPLGPSATQITVREDGFVSSPLWRFLGHYVMGEQTSVKQFVADLQAEALRKRQGMR